MKNPVLFVHHIMGFADFRLKELENRSNTEPCIFIVTGGVGAGKTSFITCFIKHLKAENIKVGGIYSQKIVENEITTGYKVVDIKTRKSARFLSLNGHEFSEQIGRFKIHSEGLELGNSALQTNRARLIIVDEIGKLELSGKGWAGALQNLLEQQNSHFLLSVREEFVDEIIEKFQLHPSSVYNISGNDNTILQKESAAFISQIIKKVKS